MVNVRRLQHTQRRISHKLFYEIFCARSQADDGNRALLPLKIECFYWDDLTFVPGWDDDDYFGILTLNVAPKPTLLRRVILQPSRST